MKLDKNTLKQIDSDFARVRKEEIRKRNNTNKARSKNQERNIARYLGATRVPMSGAGMLKGDGLWNSPQGLLIYECKYSAAHHAKYGWTLRVQYDWITKLDKDVAAMKARFGFLVVSFYNQIGGFPWSIVLIREEAIAPFMEPEWLEGAYEYEHIDQRVAVRLYYTEVRQTYKLNKAFPCAKLPTPYGMMIMLPLWALKQLLVGMEKDDDSSGVSDS